MLVEQKVITFSNSSLRIKRHDSDPNDSHNSNEDSGDNRQ